MSHRYPPEIPNGPVAARIGRPTTPDEDNYRLACENPRYLDHLAQEAYDDNRQGYALRGMSALPNWFDLDEARRQLWREEVLRGLLTAVCESQLLVSTT